MKWFTIEEINEKTYAISEYNHWEQVHSYLLIGDSFALLIDTGLGIGKIKDEVVNLTNLPIRVVSTHVHWDHIGGHGDFDYIYVHEDEHKWISNGIGIPLEVIKRNVVKDVKEFPEGFDIENYKVFTGKPNHILKDKDIIDLGNRQIEIIHTPGHSPGHICFYDLDYNFLFTGDLIYKGTLYAFYPSTDPVKYKESVKKLLRYRDVQRLLPAHNELDISVDMTQRVYNAFNKLDEAGKIQHGSGVFKYIDFSIHI